MMYTVKILFSQRTRFALTVIGISLCVILMLFLFGVYKGVADGSVDYIRENSTDLWILQRNSTNILRGTSILSLKEKELIEQNANVQSVSPVLFLITTISNSENHSTVFLAGYNPGAGLGGPPKIIRGRNVTSDDEIVLDKSFAVKNGFNPGDKVFILDDTLTVTGISSGTNAFVIQYAFTTLEEAQSLFNFPGVVTCYLVKLRDKNKITGTAGELRSVLKDAAVYDHNNFLENNIKEMESGFLPILLAVAALGAVVLTTLLSLILSISILEKKKDFAVMKILGASRLFLPKLILQQALFICLSAEILGTLVYFPLVFIIEQISPEISTKTSVFQIIIVLAIGLVMGMLSSIIAVNRLRKIYPLEVFYER